LPVKFTRHMLPVAMGVRRSGESHDYCRGKT